MKKIVSIIALIIIIISITSSNVFALSDMFSEAKDWTTTGRANAGKTIDTSELKTASDTIYNILLGIGIAAAVIVGSILGLQFMTAGVEKKVDVKEALIPYVISCVIVFGSFGIWKLTTTILSSIEKSSSSSVVIGTQATKQDPGGNKKETK